jgi:ribulose-5-phosphate 4-epimerase/fuculose-1-phosphate aldolase
MASVELRRVVEAGGIAVVDGSRGLLTRWFLDGLSSALAARGHPVQRERKRDVRIDPGVKVVINAVDPERPISFRRRSKEIFVVGVAEVPARPDEMLSAGYSLLVRTLSNVFIPIARGDGGPEAYFITMEQGFHRISHDTDDDAFFEQVVQRILPLAESRLVIDNEFIPDLDRDLWNGDEHTEALFRTGQRLAELDLLPAPWPIEELLSPADLRHVSRLFGIGGLSYGNASARHAGDAFWMSASGVDKSHLQEIGREILLVTGYDQARGVILLSVPPGVKPRRVSVDAIEHLTIYREHPGVGAILHVHGWVTGATSTEAVYPCGTEELAREVAGLVRDAPDPARAIIGMKNHGVTITGSSLDEILERVGPHIVRRVPMS